MAKQTIFYSWQSDRPNSINRGFIEACLERAIKELQADENLQLDPALDRDTANVPGSPDIAATIFEKINRADIFVADVTFIDDPPNSRRTPNPNVLVELGYAAGRLGWDRIICVFNEQFGEICELPFDIRQRRLRPYRLAEMQDKPDVRKMLASALKADIRSILHAPDQAEAEALGRFVGEVLNAIIPVLIFGEQFVERFNAGGQLRLIQLRFQNAAKECRELATSEISVNRSMAMELEDLAGRLEDIAHMQLHLGSGPELEKCVQTAVEKATAIKAARIDGHPLSPDSISKVRADLTGLRRELGSLNSRAQSLVRNNRISHVKSQASEIGLRIQYYGYFQLDVMQSSLAERLRKIGRKLHLVETITVSLDGKAINEILELLQQGTKDLDELVDGLPK